MEEFITKRIHGTLSETFLSEHTSMEAPLWETDRGQPCLQYVSSYVCYNNKNGILVFWLHNLKSFKDSLLSDSRLKILEDNMSMLLRLFAYLNISEYKEECGVFTNTHVCSTFLKHICFATLSIVYIFIIIIVVLHLYLKLGCIWVFFISFSLIIQRWLTTL